MYVKTQMKRLALGTAQFGRSYGIANQHGQVSRASACKMLNLAFNHGLDLLDTAIAYGESESCLGEAGVKDFKVVTKLPEVPEKCNNVTQWVSAQIDASLRRLASQSVYGLLLHRPLQLLEPVGTELHCALMALKNANIVKKVGISVYSPDELAALLPRFPIDIVQAPLNLIDQRMKTSGWLGRLKQNKIEVYARSAFLQGLLLMPRSEIPSKFLPWNDIISEWHDWLDRRSVSALQACLAYPLSFPEVDRVIVGADSVRQLSQIIDAASKLDLCPALPDLACTDENLINPALWSYL